MKKSMIFVLAMLLVLAATSVSATNTVECTSPGVSIASNPEQTIIVCDDPKDSVCEQDFATICPADYHLCSAEEYNAGNDNWEGKSDGVPMLGQIQCRQTSGAGHFSVPKYGGVVYFSTDQPNNMWAGSSIPGVCESSYGCNEKQYYALCCGNPGGNGGNDVPEFTGLGAGLVILGIGLLIWKKKN